MTAAAKGYPTAVRTARPIARPSGIGRTIQAAVNDNWVLNSQRDYSRFLKAPSGIALEAGGGRLAGRVAARALPFLGTALLVADLYDLWWSITTPGDVLPRDPAHYPDVELIPPPAWRHSETTWVSPNVLDGHDPSTSKWFIHTPFSPTVLGRMDKSAPPLVTWEEDALSRGNYIPISPIDIEAGNWPSSYDPKASGWELIRVERYPANSSLGSPRPGTEIMESTRPDAAGEVGMTPTFANPPRVSEGTTVTFRMPGAAPQPQPFRRTGEATHPYTERGPVQPAPAPTPVYGPVPPTITIEIPAPGSAPGANPGPAQPQPGSAPSVGTPVSSAPNPNPGKREPPTKGEDESKVKIRRGSVVGALANAGGVAGELLDIMNAAWDALPPEAKPGYYKLHYKDKKTGEIKTYWKRRFRASLNQRHAAVMEHAGSIDIPSFIKNLIANNIQDAMFGKLGQAMQKAGAKNGNMFGWQIGPWDTFAGKAFQEYQRKQKLDADRARREAEAKAQRDKESMRAFGR